MRGFGGSELREDPLFLFLQRFEDERLDRDEEVREAAAGVLFEFGGGRAGRFVDRQAEENVEGEVGGLLHADGADLRGDVDAGAPVVHPSEARDEMAEDRLRGGVFEVEHRFVRGGEGEYFVAVKSAFEQRFEEGALRHRERRLLRGRLRR